MTGAEMKDAARKSMKVEIETQLREYFYDIRGFRPMPVTFSYENVVDFVEWLQTLAGS